MADHPLLIRIRDRLDDLIGTCGTDPRAGVLVGLSGGPDSVVLLLAAQAWGRAAGRPVAAAHLHHGLRGPDADGDRDFCRALCSGLDVPFHEEAADPRPEARSRGLGLEEAGRHLRRRFFRRILAAHPDLGVVALGHHRDDQAETVVMRLFRGTGPDGLRGIRPVDPPFLRPLLAIDRAEIVACLEAVGQPWRTDASNLEGDNLRARIRRELWPVVRGIFGPGCDRTPARLAELMERDLDYLDRLTDQALGRVTHDEGSVGVPELLDLDPALAARVLRRWLANTGVEGCERAHVDGALAWLAGGRSGSRYDLPGAELEREFDRLVIGDRGPGPVPLRSAADYRILVARDDKAEGRPGGAGDLADEATWQLTAPAGALRGNLQVRNWREGDRFQPFGLDGTKKVSDLLRERRVPAGRRPGILVVADEEGILWVVGVARAERTRVLPTTERTVTISVAARADHPQRGT